jgi:hypothetical protein
MKKNYRKKETTMKEIRIGIAGLGHRAPLRVKVNGFVGEIAPTKRPDAGWYALPVARGRLRPGANEIELWAEIPLMDGWMIAMESGYPPAGSWLSLDAGRTWRGERMGLTHALGMFPHRVNAADLAVPPRWD